MTAYPSYFKNLDALRFLSFLSVFISHTILLPDTGSRVSEALLYILTFSYLGVPFFFSLSSFLITYRLLTERERNGTIALLKFYKNRTLRIWPAYYIIILVCYLLLPFGAYLLHVKGPTLPPVLPFVFFYSNFYIIENGSFFSFALVILWSISIEEQFYFAWGIIMKFILKKFVPVLIVGFFLISIVFSYYYLHSNHKSSKFLAIHSLFTLQYFCTGAMAALCYLQGWRCKIPPKVERLAFVLAYVILAFSFYFKSDFIVFSFVKSICYGLILYDQSFNKQPVFNTGWSALINYLGKISYGLYLYHALVIVILQAQFDFFMPDNKSPIDQILVQSFVTLIITFIISHLSYRYIESKFLTLKESP